MHTNLPLDCPSPSTELELFEGVNHIEICRNGK